MRLDATRTQREGAPLPVTSSSLSPTGARLREPPVEEASPVPAREVVRDPLAVKHQLPGNQMVAADEARRHGVRANRYGLAGDNGFADIVQE